MKSVSTSKWVLGVSPESPIREVAVLTLRTRLGAVAECLARAAEDAEEAVEDVHQLRVWARRAGAALALYRDLIPRRRFAWMKKQLRKVRRAAGGARDSDVLMGRLEKRGDEESRRWKELRYLMELLAGAFPEELRGQVYPVVEALQDRLGEINDLATARASLDRKVRKADGAAEADRWRRLLAREQAALDAGRKQLEEWLTPKRLADLRDRFERLLTSAQGGRPDASPAVSCAERRHGV